MKTPINLLLIILFLSFNSCSKEDNCENPIDCLPAITFMGKNTFGCLVDGEIFKPTSTGMGGSGLDVHYKNTGVIESLSISAINHKKDNAVYLVIVGDIEADNTYKLASAKDSTYALYSENLSYYETFKESSGTVIINYFDRDKGIISGVFSFSAKNEAGEEVSIQKGRFDLEL